MPERFEYILNDCVDRLLRGETVEQCLQLYPEQAAQLEPLLRTAAAAHAASVSVEPRPEFKAQVRYRALAELQARKGKRRRNRMPVLGWLPRWAAVTMATLLFVLVAGASTVAAASNSLPGETLYPVKMATERVQYTFAFSEEKTAELHARFAQRRAEELARLAEAGNEERVQALASRFEAYLEKIEALAAKIKQAEPGNQVRLAALRQRIASNEARDVAMLETAEKNAPPRFKPAIARYSVRIARAYEAALEALDGTDS